MPLRLREWREHRGYSIRELAARAGIGFATVYRIESARMSPTVALLEKLAKALEIDVRDFFPASRRSEPNKRRR
jgi:transcriptional regulator with XRE-family HTH domain